MNRRRFLETTALTCGSIVLGESNVLADETRKVVGPNIEEIFLGRTRKLVLQPIAIIEDTNGNRQGYKFLVVKTATDHIETAHVSRWCWFEDGVKTDKCGEIYKKDTIKKEERLVEKEFQKGKQFTFNAGFISLKDYNGNEPRDYEEKGTFSTDESGRVSLLVKPSPQRWDYLLGPEDLEKYFKGNTRDLYSKVSLGSRTRTTVGIPVVAVDDSSYMGEMPFTLFNIKPLVRDICDQINLEDLVTSVKFTVEDYNSHWPIDGGVLSLRLEDNPLDLKDYLTKYFRNEALDYAVDHLVNVKGFPRTTRGKELDSARIIDGNPHSRPSPFPRKRTSATDVGGLVVNRKYKFTIKHPKYRFSEGTVEINKDTKEVKLYLDELGSKVRVELVQ